MDEKEQYQSLISDIIAKQAVILGPDIAMLKARNVSELEISKDGKITEIHGDSSVALQKLINEYVNLSGLIVKNALGSIFEKYPAIKKIE